MRTSDFDDWRLGLRDRLTQQDRPNLHSQHSQSRNPEVVLAMSSVSAAEVEISVRLGLHDDSVGPWTDVVSGLTRMDMDWASYDASSGSMECVLGTQRAQCRDAAPWDVVEALARLIAEEAAGVDVEVLIKAVENSRPGQTLDDEIDSKGSVKNSNMSVVDPCDIDSSAKKLRLRLLLKIKTRIIPGMKLTPPCGHALTCISFRAEKSVQRLMPVESFDKHAEKLAKGGHGQDEDAFRLAALYRESYLLTTGRQIDNVEDVNGLGSLDSLSRTKQGERTVRPAENASQRAAEALMQIEHDVQEKFLGSGKLKTRMFYLTQFMLENIASFLDSKSVINLRRTCKYLRFAYCTIVPGLRVPLYSHQKHALRWMDRQESQGRKRGELEAAGIGAAAIATLPDMVRRICEYPDLCWLHPGLIFSELPESKRENIVVVRRTGHVLRFDNRLPSCPPLMGGMLCDEPGLGKTVTMLALILRTAGLETPRSVTMNKLSERADMAALQMNDVWVQLDQTLKWRHLHELCRKLSTAVHGGKKGRSSMFPISRMQHACLLTIASLESRRDLHTESFTTVVAEFRLFVENTHVWFPHPDEPKYMAEWRPLVSQLSDALNQGIIDMQGRYGRGRSRRACRGREADDARKKASQREELIPSSTTLVVVPKTLLQHWRTQVALHIDTRYIYTSSDEQETEGAAPATASTSKAGKREKSKEPVSKASRPLFYFDDDHTNELPPAKELASYVAVFTTNPRLTREERSETWASSLCKIHWLRIVVDEGHALGSCTQTMYGSFLTRLTAQRRWVMTGTPAKETSLMDGLRTILGVMRFLRLPPYGLAGGGTVWSAIVARALERRIGVGVAQFVAVLSDVMMRHTKIDVAELPPLVLRSVGLQLTPEERQSYNAIVAFGRTNIALTSAGREGFDVSLLNITNQRMALQLLENLRLSCSGGGSMGATLARQSWMETRMLLESHEASPEQIREANEFTMRVCAGRTTACQAPGCPRVHRIVLITPCVHYMCVECFEQKCVKTDSYACLYCNKPFSVNQFAALQPGFELYWRKDSASILARASSKAQYIIKTVARLREELGKKFKCILYSQFSQVRNILGHELIISFGSGAVCEYADAGRYRDVELRKYTHNEGQVWDCAVCGTENDAIWTRCQQHFLTLVNEADDSDVEEMVPQTSLSEYFIGKEWTLLERVRDQYRPPNQPFVATRLRTRMVTKDARCTGKSKQGTWRVRKDLNCSILMLSRDGSVGLDLSMTSHIFLVDKIWDAAVMDQVVSRAWRLGTQAPEIIVEELFSKGTVEDLMYDWRPGLMGRGDGDDNDEEHREKVPATSSKGVTKTSATAVKDTSKIRFLLENMRVIDDVPSPTEQVPVVSNTLSSSSASSSSASTPPASQTSSANAPAPKRRRVHFV